MFSFNTASVGDSEPQVQSLTSTGTVSDMLKLPYTVSPYTVSDIGPLLSISAVSGSESGPQVQSLTNTGTVSDKYSL